MAGQSSVRLEPLKQMHGSLGGNLVATLRVGTQVLTLRVQCVLATRSVEACVPTRSVGTSFVREASQDADRSDAIERRDIRDLKQIGQARQQAAASVQFSGRDFGHQSQFAPLDVRN